MNPNISLKEVKEFLKKNGTSFKVLDDSAREDGALQFAFVGEFEGKEVVFDVFMMTLEFDFFTGVLEEAINQTIELHPEFKEADFDAIEGKHIDIMDDIAAELAKDEDFQVCEYLDIEEGDDNVVELDVSLNITEVSDEAIKKFINDFTTGELELDETYFSFELDDEEE